MHILKLIISFLIMTTRKKLPFQNPVRILNTFKKQWPMHIFVHNSVPNGQLFIICFIHIVNNSYDTRCKSQGPESHAVLDAWGPQRAQGQPASVSQGLCVLSLLFVHPRPCFSLSGPTFCRGSVGGLLWAMVERKSEKSPKNIDANKYHVPEIQHEWGLLAFRC